MRINWLRAEGKQMETVSQQQSSAEVAKKNVFTIDIDEYIGHYFGLLGAYGVRKS